MKFPVHWILAISVFATGAFGGFLLTGMPHLTQENWLYLAGGRVLWQLGGAAWLGYATASLFEASRWKFALPFALVGGLLSVNPILDLARGPQFIEGRLASVRYIEGTIWTTRMPSRTIDVAIEIITTDGRTHHFKAKGSHATQWSIELKACAAPGRNIRMRLLRHLETAIQVSCIGAD
ncbi:MAG TPA: hypothetical protein VF267_14095 [Gammaproteobacteria bacterium]